MTNDEVISIMIDHFRGDKTKAYEWFITLHSFLGSSPKDLMRTPSGSRKLKKYVKSNYCTVSVYAKSSKTKPYVKVGGYWND